MGDRARLELILDEVRARGGRVTAPRRAILAELLEAGGHVTAEQLAGAVQARHPDVHQSTVYRFLDTLTALRIVEHVHLGHGPAVYHLTDDRHHHLVCEGCGVVVEVPNRTVAPLARRLERDYGFQLDATHFALAGRCRACLPT